MALAPTLDAMARNAAVDQILFATAGDITETGAATFLADDKTIVTRQLDSSFLHGVTRSSVISLAADLGYEAQERRIELDELEDCLAAKPFFRVLQQCSLPLERC